MYAQSHLFKYFERKTLRWEVRGMPKFGFLSRNAKYPIYGWNCIYNIAFVNSERWLAKSRADITLRQHGKFPATLLVKFFVLVFPISTGVDITVYQHGKCFIFLK